MDLEKGNFKLILLILGRKIGNGEFFIFSFVFVCDDYVCVSGYFVYVYI